jgi:hypothetical protein
LPQPNAYGKSNSHIDADIYTDCDGNSYVYSDCDGHGDCDGNSHAYADSDCDGDCHIHANGDSDSNVHSNRNCHSDSNGYRHRYSNCDRIAAGYTDATTTAYTTASSLIVFGIRGTRENDLASPHFEGSKLVAAGQLKTNFRNGNTSGKSPLFTAALKMQSRRPFTLVFLGLKSCSAPLCSVWGR